MQPEEYVQKLVLAITSSSLSTQEQNALLEKLKKNEFTQEDLDLVLTTMEKDIDSMEYAAKVIEQADEEK